MIIAPKRVGANLTLYPNRVKRVGLSSRLGDHALIIEAEIAGP